MIIEKVKKVNNLHGELSSYKVTHKDSNIVYCVPLDEDNMDYAEIKRQVDAGELTIEDAD
tara:strand:+ start:113 stop:292 length:180 start_codon:yes stop_codon:yes gene_type:complete